MMAEVFKSTDAGFSTYTASHNGISVQHSVKEQDPDKEDLTENESV